jgi:hypothetical protein
MAILVSCRVDVGLTCWHATGTCLKEEVVWQAGISERQKISNGHLYMNPTDP